MEELELELTVGKNYVRKFPSHSPEDVARARRSHVNKYRNRRVLTNYGITGR